MVQNEDLSPYAWVCPHTRGSWGRVGTYLLRSSTLPRDVTSDVARRRTRTCPDSHHSHGYPTKTCPMHADAHHTLVPMRACRNTKTCPQFACPQFACRNSKTCPQFATIRTRRTKTCPQFARPIRTRPAKTCPQSHPIRTRKMKTCPHSRGCHQFARAASSRNPGRTGLVSARTASRC